MSEFSPLEVYHLDDQPELVGWIPRALSMWFWKNFKLEMRDAPDDEDDEESWKSVLYLRAGEEVFDTAYRIFEEPDKLMEALTNAKQDNIVLVLLDQAVGLNKSAGCETYRRIERDFPKALDRTFMLSAYPNTVLAELKWHVDSPRLIAKPAAPELIIRHFINQLIEVRKPMPGTREKLGALILQ